MTDKVQKIRKEVERMHELLPVMDGDSISINYADRICRTLEMYIDSLQEEPVRRTPADIEAAIQEVEEKSRAFTEAHQGEDADTILAQMRGEEPVSEELEEAAKNVGQKYFPDEDNIWARPNYEAVKAECAFMDGAKWQKGKTLSDVKKAVIGKAFQFSMENVEAWGDDSNGNGKTIKLKGRVTFQVSNPESIIDALFTELENDK